MRNRHVKTEAVKDLSRKLYSICGEKENSCKQSCQAWNEITLGGAEA